MAQVHMEPNCSVQTGPVEQGKLRLFTLYSDFYAGIRGRHVATYISRLAGEGWGCLMEMWKLDSVSPAGPIREMILQEAAEADIVIIACSAVDEPEPEMVRWLASLAPWRSQRAIAGLLIGVLGDAERQGDAGSWITVELAQFGRRSGMDFVWCNGRDAMGGTTDVNGSVLKLLADKASIWSRS